MFGVVFHPLTITTPLYTNERAEDKKYPLHDHEKKLRSRKKSILPRRWGRGRRKSILRLKHAAEKDKFTPALAHRLCAQLILILFCRVKEMEQE